MAENDQKSIKNLTKEQYHITQEAGTEAPFTGKYWDYKAEGIYKCVCCAAKLFSSEAKFDSGSGWPSFTMPILENMVALSDDHSLGHKRIEVSCANCKAHLGHVFDDGPQPTGKRFCINSAALLFSAS